MLARVAGAIVAAFALLALAASPAAAQGFIRDSEIEALLADYSRPLLEAAGVRPEDVSIFIVQDNTINAFVVGGQNIFLHTGLLLEAETPNQLKGVIAHEIGHISGGHLARSREAMQQAMTPAFISIGLGILAIAAGAPEAGAALISGSQQFALADYLRHSKVQESAADQAGLTFLEKSGQSGEGLIEFFEKYRYQEVVSEERRNPYFRSHPLSSDRIEALRERVGASEHATATDSAEDVLRFERMQAKLYGFLETPGRTFARYPASDTTATARYARAVAAYRVPDTAAALAETEALIALEPENPFFHELMGQILFESGRAAESVSHHRTAANLRPDDPLLLVNLARALAASGGAEAAPEAIGILKTALAREPDNGFAWRELAAAYAVAGEESLARLATAEQAFVVGDYARAQNFAERAKRGLDEGSVDWRRAADIAMISETALRESPGRRRG